MAQWHRNIQDIITIIDACIRAQQDEALTLRALAQKLGYSEYYTSRKFWELAGMTLRDYLRLRRLAFALRDVCDTDMGILDIAVQYGFSSNEAFTRAFKKAYGVSPSAYRTAPGPVVLRTILRPFDCYLMEGASDMNETQSAGEVQTYFVHIPAHKFLHIRNYESIGYWDFWQRLPARPDAGQGVLFLPRLRAVFQIRAPGVQSLNSIKKPGRSDGSVPVETVKK